MSAPERKGAIERFDESRVKGAHIRWTVLAAMGDYIDAGSIVAGAASLTFWVNFFHLSTLISGVVAALSPNAFAAALGALLAGPLGDRFGRKAIYMYDLIAYTVGALIVALAVNTPMLILGYIITGIAVGVDVPTSWSLIAEYAPRRARGRLMSFTSLFWYIGPIVILLIAIGTSPLGVNSFRILFGSLAAVAIITWVLRRGIIESPRWAAVAGRAELVDEALRQLGESGVGVSQPTPQVKAKWTEVFTKYWKGLAFIIPIYIMWGIPAGTFGFFLPFFTEGIAGRSVVVGDLMQILWFVTAIIGVVAVAMQLSDRVNRRLLYAISSLVCAAGFAIPIGLPFKVLLFAALNVFLFGFGHGIGLWPITRMWSVELFPTELRNRAQGFVWAMMRTSLGIWSLYVPTIIATIGYSAIAAVATSFFLANAVIGGLLGPKSQGKSLEEIQREFYGR